MPSKKGRSRSRSKSRPRKSAMKKKVTITTPNQMWTDQKDFVFGVPVYTDKSTVAAHLKQFPNCRIFENSNYFIMDDKDFITFQKTGVLPVFKDDLKELRVQMDVLAGKIARCSMLRSEMQAPPPFEKKFSKQTLEVSDDEDFKVERPDTPLRVREEPMVPPISASAKAVTGVLAVARKAMPPKSN